MHRSRSEMAEERGRRSRDSLANSLIPTCPQYADGSILVRQIRDSEGRYDNENRQFSHIPGHVRLRVDPENPQVDITNEMSTDNLDSVKSRPADPVNPRRPGIL